MKKFLILSSLLCTSLLSALQVGNPTQSTMLNCSIGFDWITPKYLVCNWMDFRFGYLGDYVYNFPTKLNGESYGENVNTAWTTNSLYLATNFFNRIDFISSYGTTNITIEQFVPSSSTTTNSAIREIVSQSQFSWTTGLHATLVQCCGFGIGVGGDYFYTCPQVDYVNFFGPNPAYGSNGVNLKLSEWQAFLGINYTFPIAPTLHIIPYGAAKWNGLYLKGSDASLTSITGLTSISTIIRNFDNTQTFGYAIGVTLEGCKRFSGTIEGRFANERAFSFNVQARF